MIAAEPLSDFGVGPSKPCGVWWVILDGIHICMGRYHGVYFGGIRSKYWRVLDILVESWFLSSLHMVYCWYMVELFSHIWCCITLQIYDLWPRWEVSPSDDKIWNANLEHIGYFSRPQTLKKICVGLPNHTRPHFSKC